jgi:hypothetical protein
MVRLLPVVGCVSTSGEMQVDCQKKQELQAASMVQPIVAQIEELHKKPWLLVQPH